MSVQELKVRQKDMDKLSPKMRKFLGEYLITYEPMNSAIAAGYSKKTAAVMAQKLLKHPIVSKYIAAAEKKSQDDYELTRYEIIEQLAYCVLRTSDDFIDEETGKLKPLHELSNRAKACIDGIEQEVTVLKDIDGNEIGEKIKTKIKLVPKASAMDMAMKHKGLFAAEKHEVNGKLSMQHEFPFAKLMGATGVIEEDEVEKLIEAEGRVISEVPDD